MAAFHGVTGTKVLALNGHWDNLDLGLCEAGVWNTGWCCMALPTLYYSTVFSPGFRYGYTLIWSRNAQTENSAGLFSFPFRHLYNHIIICGPWLSEAMDKEGSQTQAAI